MNLVRTEIYPDDLDYSIPIEEWEYHVDQDILPSWYDAEDVEKRCRIALENVWAKRHIVSDAVVSVDYMVIALTEAIVNAHAGAKVRANAGSVVYANAGSVVYAYTGSVVYAYAGSVVYAYAGSVVYAYDGSVVYAYAGSVVYDHDGSTVKKL